MLLSIYGVLANACEKFKHISVFPIMLMGVDAPVSRVFNYKGKKCVLKVIIAVNPLQKMQISNVKETWQTILTKQAAKNNFHQLLNKI